eukprot:Gregarina_sp_Poly_1__7478@NODE_416_length_8734_cov_134_157609_g338_i0_p1_GENE_NODE_416_length_8734_cov_134_157609_g338_i0NODE_416_length_8734_cov_134_157609_g338_i0_p1_ORF_typecomplete_len848_score138_71ERCC3_RAD25_C/PF16203_5/1_5e81Helicase_C_3/PF13625_6/3_1e33ResIII/PF04851_15/1_3e20SNF2_N/PF00176_23/4_7e09SNF2_N/PF00176_23/1_3e03Helicase_C/PF00271_31/2_4e08AAA_30/PF13604_6/1_4AAA_30/PF13604_6/0_00024AAA_11/PF13086_6/2_6e03AAA_11/PF13086_6/0_033AAA_11/PF13086_6/4_4e02AAA_19/PF13245_6/2_9AAA_19
MSAAAAAAATSLIAGVDGRKRRRPGGGTGGGLFGANELGTTTGDPVAKRPAFQQPSKPITLNLAQKPISRGYEGSTILPLTANAIMQDPSISTLDFSSLMMKAGDDDRPLLVCPNGYIFLETTGPQSAEASEFLIAIAEPVSRPETIHEFQITVFSLYAALSMGIQLQELLEGLDRYSKNDIPSVLERELRTHGSSFGKVKLVLRDGKYFIESPWRDELELMASNPTIAAARVQKSLSMRPVKAAATKSIIPVVEHAAESRNGDKPVPDFLVDEASQLDDSLLAFMQASSAANKRVTDTTGDKDKENGKFVPTKKSTPKQMVYSFEVSADKVSAIKEVALRSLSRPLLTEYDFWRDTNNPPLNIALKQTTKVRYYQERALRKMFSNGRARSGIIVLPCGAGKTLTGITAATTIKKSTMVLTSSSVAVDQWRRSFLQFTTVDPSCVVALTADSKSDLPEGAAVVCSTYTMMAYSGKRSEAAERIMNQIKAKDWGLLIFDEVQFAPAPAFRKINDLARSHCKLGLTATLVREDDLINDLQWLIGPKLDEANWLELQEAGYLAKAKCSEVWCPMTYEYFRAYLNSTPIKQRKLWVCNPNKLRACEFLVRFHEERKDKVIVFSDNLFALKEVAYALKRPFISGEVTLQERMVIINKFKTSPHFSTILLSKVGDNAIDIPCANVVIQISFNFASRRQETQRLGRILRPKPASNSNEEFNAFFYSLVSKDTQEMAYADRRQQYIIDQGYAYKVLPMSVFPMDKEKLIYDDPQKQKDMLQKILSTDDVIKDLEDDDVMLNASGAAVEESAGGSSGGSQVTGVRSRGGGFVMNGRGRAKRTAASSSDVLRQFYGE